LISGIFFCLEQGWIYRLKNAIFFFFFDAPSIFFLPKTVPLRVQFGAKGGVDFFLEQGKKKMKSRINQKVWSCRIRESWGVAEVRVFFCFVLFYFVFLCVCGNGQRSSFGAKKVKERRQQLMIPFLFCVYLECQKLRSRRESKRKANFSRSTFVFWVIVSFVRKEKQVR
jgi:hypothetical protein